MQRTTAGGRARRRHCSREPVPKTFPGRRRGGRLRARALGPVIESTSEQRRLWVRGRGGGNRREGVLGGDRDVCLSRGRARVSDKPGRVGQRPAIQGGAHRPRAVGRLAAKESAKPCQEAISSTTKPCPGDSHRLTTVTPAKPADAPTLRRLHLAERSGQLARAKSSGLLLLVDQGSRRSQN